MSNGTFRKRHFSAGLILFTFLFCLFPNALTRFVQRTSGSSSRYSPFLGLARNAKMPILQKETSSDRDGQVRRRVSVNEDVFGRCITFYYEALSPSLVLNVLCVSTTDRDSFTSSPLGETIGSQALPASKGIKLLRTHAHTHTQVVEQFPL